MSWCWFQVNLHWSLGMRHLGIWSTIAMFGFAAVAVAQVAPDSAPLPAPGRLIDIGGWRLHLNCTGQARSSQPIVVLEAGVGDFSVEWSLVQPAVSGFGRVCSYDRGGDGWSDVGPHPRTFHQVVYELHTLLERAGERPPYLLIGHSYGGWLVRTYQAVYPTEVAAMVLVDAGEDNPLRMLPNGQVVRASEMGATKPIPAVNTSRPLRESDIPPAALSQMKAGATASIADANTGPRAKLPRDAQRMRTWALGRWQHVAAAVNPFEIEEIMQLRAARLSTEHPLGTLPLVVITRGIADEKGPDGAAIEAQHRSDHAAVAAMSSVGRQVIATQSGHHVQLDQPDLVVATIRDLLAEIQKNPPRGDSHP
jgi:pimeloyl-ACP methyl ester carboxylesterase